MRATDPNSDDFSLELLSLHLNLNEGFEDNNRKIENNLVGTFQQQPLCPSSRAERQDLDQLPSSVCHDLDPEFSSSLLDQLLILEETQPVPQNNTRIQQAHVFQVPMAVDMHIPMDTSISTDSSVTSPTYITSNHTSPSVPVTYPTPGSTPPSPYSPYVASANATPVMTPTAVTPIMSPHSSKPSSPRGSYRRPHHYRRSVSKETIIKAESSPNADKLPRHKRPSHILAEHKRRSKIQKGFEDVQNLVPAIADAGTTKPSKSTMLLKTVEYCRQLRSENKELQRESDKVRKEIEALTSEINQFQVNLPQAGVEAEQANTPEPSTGSTSRSMDEMFSDYVRAKTLSNWKFSIFGMLIRPLFSTFKRMVSTKSRESLAQTVTAWIEEHLSLIALRPVVFSALRELSTETSIMSAPEKLPEEIIQNVLRESFPTSHNKHSPQS